MTMQAVRDLTPTLSSTERFLGRISPEPMSGCWLWTGSTDGRYGTLLHDGHTYRAHRYAWAAANGPLSKSLVVCHKCDNMMCVNLDHLFLGTTSDNASDMARKGRHWAATRTHCRNGHHMTEDNISSRRYKRSCKACESAFLERRRAKHRAWCRQQTIRRRELRLVARREESR